MNFDLTFEKFIRNDILMKVKKSEGFALLTDKAIEITNVQQLVTFIIYYDVVLNKRKMSFIQTFNKNLIFSINIQESM